MDGPLYKLLILGELCDADYDAISKWSFDLTIDDESLLTESGRTEMKELGQRYKARLPEIFDETYNEDNIIVLLIYLITLDIHRSKLNYKKSTIFYR